MLIGSVETVSCIATRGWNIDSDNTTTTCISFPPTVVTVRLSLWVVRASVHLFVTLGRPIYCGQTPSGVLLKMEVGIRKGAWQRARRYPAYL